MQSPEAQLPVKSDSFSDFPFRLKSMLKTCALTGHFEMVVMQTEDNDEDQVSIYAGVRFTGSTAGN